MSRSPLLTLTALVLPLLAGCNGMNWVRHERSFEFSKPVNSANSLDVQLTNGDVSVVVTPGGGSELRAKGRIFANAGTVEGAKRLADQSELTIEPTVDGATGSAGSRTLYVRLKRPADITTGSVNADVELTLPASMSLTLQSTNGGITVESNSAPVTAKSTNAKIRISEQSGDVVATTTNGAIEIKSLGGGVKCSSTNGRVRIVANPNASERIRAKSSNGPINAEFPKLAGATLHTKTTNGDVTVWQNGSKAPEVRQAADADSAQIDLKTTNADISVSFGPASK
ncbi:MAG: DUF4097 family beta strand repeat-containing protein [Phycisphaerae bacterium]|nr:DUF4097 family beta strand repeat-containing protein [Phycisphaerae bacterium]